jgi:hypothetical protein
MRSSIYEALRRPRTLRPDELVAGTALCQPQPSNGGVLVVFVLSGLFGGWITNRIVRTLGTEA